MIIEYKGHAAKIEYSDEDEVYFGKILGTKDTILFEVDDITEVQEAFIECVECYIDLKERIKDS